MAATSAIAVASTTSLVLQGGLAASRSALVGSSLNVVPVKSLSCSSKPYAGARAENSEQACGNAQIASVSRRLALSLLAGAAAVGSRVRDANAAYGEAANVFGSPKKESGFSSIVGKGFKLSVPSKWNPSKEVEFPGQVVRYEDNFDSVNNLSVNITPSEKSSIKDYGTPEQFLNSVSYLLGRQSYSGKTVSEGGFDPNSVATAAVLEASTSEIDGKTYYNLSVLTRTGDGTEGGKHQLFAATVAGGKLYIMKAQAGDKRWFKGAKKLIEGAVSSFNVA